jgi:hypothetical protein
MKRFAVAGLLGVGIVAGCGSGDQLREVALGLSAAATIGRSVQLAMDGVGGTSGAVCVQVTKACATYPCDGEAALTLGADCALPLGGAATGSVTVSGHFTSATQATLTAQFVNVVVGAGKEPIALANASQLTASRSGTSITVDYAGSNAAARSNVDAASVGASSSWTVVIDTKGTATPADDSLTIMSTSASGAAGVGTTAKTQTLTGVVIDPGCALNPTGGSGQIVEVQTFIPSIRKIAFHGACDGKAQLDGSNQPFDLTP